jgi:hypothetical protein
VGLVTTDASELTSNYISRRLPELRRGMGRAGPPEPLLMDSTELRSRAHYSPQAMLVMVRNRNVRQLSQVVPQMEPLWSDWEYSVWKIPAAEEREGTGNRE